MRRTRDVEEEGGVREGKVDGEEEYLDYFENIEHQ